MDDLIICTDAGLYCPPGDFHVDPWRAVERAVITHAHSDHARPGSARYLAAEPGAAVLRHRLGPIDLRCLRYGEAIQVGETRLSLHPAGHLLGSAQARIEHRGRVAVVTGDFKTHVDPTCAAFEPQRCDHLVMESTFGLPIYRWPDPDDVARQINAWWRANRDAGVTSILYAYALGKAQRLIAALDPSIGPILLHGAVDVLTTLYRDAGVDLPPTRHATPEASRDGRGRAIVIAPMSVHGSPWLRRFAPVATAAASGWMAVRATRRYRSVDRGFVLSDHADDEGLLRAVALSGATRVDVTHGYAEALARRLRETRGLDARPLVTRFQGERLGEEPAESPSPSEAQEA